MDARIPTMEDPVLKVHSLNYESVIAPKLNEVQNICEIVKDQVKKPLPRKQRNRHFAPQYRGAASQCQGVSLLALSFRREIRVVLPTLAAAQRSLYTIYTSSPLQKTCDATIEDDRLHAELVAL